MTKRALGMTKRALGMTGKSFVISTERSEWRNLKKYVYL